MNTATPTSCVSVKSNENSGRARFDKPQNGFELTSSFTRSQAKHLLSLQERALFYELADYVGDASLTAFPSVNTLAAALDTTPRSVRRWLCALEKHGFITRQQRVGSTGDYISNLYTLSVPHLTGVSVPGDTGVSTPTDTGDSTLLTGVSDKETKEQTSKKKQCKTTPIVPLKGKERVRVPLTDPICVAIAEVCQLDIEVNSRKIQKLATELAECRYGATHVRQVPRVAETGEYCGPMTPAIIKRSIAMTVGEKERPEVFRPYERNSP